MIPESTEVKDLSWRTARRSAGNGACVEVAPANGQIFVRDSKNQNGPVIHYPARSWRQFVKSARSGRFDPSYL
jgi:Domain of unknown function (DUF397)